MGNGEKHRTMDRNGNREKQRRTERSTKAELPGMVMRGQDSAAEWSGCAENVIDWFGTW